MRLLVVGAGIAGSSFARHAREAGHDVTVVADPDRPPASLAALCVVRADWFKDGQRAEAEWSIDWYRRNGWLTTDRVAWSTYRKPGVRVRDGFAVIDPIAPLVEPDWHEPFRATLRTAAFDVLVLARGAYAPDKPGWGLAHGVTTTFRHDGWGCGGHEDRPRNAVYSVSHDGQQVRFGSSKGSTAETAMERQLRAEAESPVFPDGAEVERVTGVRLMPPRGEQPGPIRRMRIGSGDARIWTVEGFGRVGYSLAPARTRALLGLIEQEADHGRQGTQNQEVRPQGASS